MNFESFVEQLENGPILNKSFSGPTGRTIDRAKLVSFDLFDTLVRRPFLEPSHLFDYVERKNQLIHFGKLRRRAEQAARVAMKPSPDIAIKHIYDRLGGIYDKEFELSAELDFLYPREKIADLFRYIRDEKKNIAIITDMYLDSAFIETILDRFDLRPNILIISNRDGVIKGDGSAFKKLIADSKLEPKDIVHIGDNPVSDFQAPMSLGIKSIQLSNHSIQQTQSADVDFANLFDRLSNNSSLDSSIAGAAIRDSVEKICTVQTPHDNLHFWRLIGAIYAGPLTIDFCHWIAKVAISRKIKRLIFVARDGKLPFQIFGRMFENFEIHYVLLSRAALIASDLENPCDTTLEQLVSGVAAPVSSYITRLGLADDQLLKLAIREFGRDKIIKSSNDREKLASFFYKYRSLLKNFSRDSRDALQLHLINANAFECPSETAFIDIGWGGTTAKILKSIFQEGQTWKYLYFGTRPSVEESNNSLGFAFDFGEPRELHDIAFSCIELPEFLFTAPEESVVRLIKQDDLVKPLFTTSDYWPERAEIVRAIHEGANATYESFSRFPKQLEYWPDPTLIRTLISDLIFPQSNTIGEKFSQIRHSLGAGNVKAVPIVPDNSPQFWTSLRRIAKGKSLKFESKHVFWGYYAEKKFYDEQNRFGRYLIRQAYKIRRRGGIKIFGKIIPV